MATPANAPVTQIPTITGLIMSKMVFAAQEPVTYTVQGVGGPCRFHVIFTPPLAMATQTSNDKNPPPPPSPNAPTQVSVAKEGALPMNTSENPGGALKPGKYSVVARAEGSDHLGGNGCKGQASVHGVIIGTPPSGEPAALATETSTNQNRRGTINALQLGNTVVGAADPIPYIVDGIGQECAFQVRFVSETTPGVEYPFPKVAKLPVNLVQNTGVGQGLIKPGKYTVIAAASAADQAGGKGCLGQAQAKLEVKAAPVAGPIILVGGVSVVSKITGLSFSKSQFSTEEPFAYTVQGSGGPCKFHIRFQPLAGGNEIAFAKEATLPFSAAQNEGVGKGLIKPGVYAVSAAAYSTDVGSANACAGSAGTQITVVAK